MPRLPACRRHARDPEVDRIAGIEVVTIQPIARLRDRGVHIESTTTADVPNLRRSGSSGSSATASPSSRWAPRSCTCSAGAAVSCRAGKSLRNDRQKVVGRRARQVLQKAAPASLLGYPSQRELVRPHRCHICNIHAAPALGTNLSEPSNRANSAAIDRLRGAGRLRVGSECGGVRAVGYRAGRDQRAPRARRRRTRRRESSRCGQARSLASPWVRSSGSARPSATE